MPQSAAQRFKNRIRYKDKVCPDGERVPQGFPCKQLPPNRRRVIQHKAIPYGVSNSRIHKPIPYGVSTTRRNGK